MCKRLGFPFYSRTIVRWYDRNKVHVLGFSVENTLHPNAAKYQSKHFHAAGCWLYRIAYIIYRTRAIISRSRFEAALVYKPRILSLKIEEFPFLVHKLSAI